MAGRKFTSTVAGATILITVVGLIGKGLGLIREIVFANFFGLNTQYDLYLVGAVLPITINTIILYLGQNYFIPNYNKAKNEEPEKIESFTNSAFWVFTIFGLLLAVVLYYFSSFIVKLYLHEASYSDYISALEVFRIFLFTIPLNAAYAILAAFLQSEFEFKAPAVSQLCLNIAIILLVIVFSNRIGVYTIPAGYVAGSLVQLIYLVIKAGRRVRLNIFLFAKSRNISSIVTGSLIITILIETISQIYLLADRYFFDEVQKGGIASLNYAMNLYLLPVTIISVALSTAIFPSFSQSFSANIKEEVQSKLDNFFSVNLFLFIPISMILILYGNVFIRLLFQRGEFNAGATEMTFEVIKYYSISLVFYSSYIIINKLLYSANLTKILLIITASGCILKIAANFLLVKDYQQNGLAVSTTISYIFYFIIGMIIVITKLRLSIKKYYKEFLFDILNSIISFSISLVIFPNSLIKNNYLNDLLKLSAFIIIYWLNAKLIGQSTIKLFEDSVIAITKKKHLDN